MKVVHAHKGKQVIRVIVRGRECHSALGPNEGVNAIEFAAALITFIRSLALRSATSGPFEEGYEVPYTTIQTGVVDGGSMVNIVPKECRFEFEIRNLPQENTDDFVDQVTTYATDVLEPQMHKIDSRTGFHFEELSRYPGLQTSVDTEVVSFVRSLTEASAVGKVAFGTEAGLFQGIGIPTVVCGPGHIAQAHKPNEYVDHGQLLHCERFMQRLIDWLAQ
jgi:acetylornithine deacetylase